MNVPPTLIIIRLLCDFRQDPKSLPKQKKANRLRSRNVGDVHLLRFRLFSQAREAIELHRVQAQQANAARTREVLSSGEFEPSWKDPKALQTGLTTVIDYLSERGVPQELINGLDNHVLVEIAEESRRYRDLQKQKPKAALAVKGKPAPVKPGAKSTATPQSEGLRQMQEKYRSNPTLENGIALERLKASMRKPGFRN